MVTHKDSGHPEDKLLVNRVLRGDKGAFGIIVRNTEALVAQIVTKMIPGIEDRKDLAQDIYLKAFNHLATFRFQSKLSTWIAQIAYNTCLSWIEKKKLYFPGNLQEEDDRSPVSHEAVYNMPRNSVETERILFQKEVSVILKKEIESLP